MPATEPVDWRDGLPHSPRFGEGYRSRSGALAQAATVFLGGCGLPQAWQGRTAYAVLETGFGLGINFLATWARWEADPQRCSLLRYRALEAYPVAADELLRSARQALAEAGEAAHAWSRLPELAQALAQHWATLRAGLQTWMLADGQLELTLAVGEVVPMLGELEPSADAVYLDGFSPSVNPQMWSPQALAAVARHGRAGTRLATYTTQRGVRDGLEALGFDVRRCPGLPPKKHRLEAALQPHAAWGSPAIAQAAPEPGA